MSDVSMRKTFYDYDAYVFDLDGTLYFQKQLRFIMAGRLAGYYLVHFWRIRELLIVKKFREVREKWDSIAGSEKTEGAASSDIDRRQYNYISGIFGVPEKKVEEIIKRWIYDNPLDAVAASKDEALADIIIKLKNKNKKVIIFSDYPTTDKLKALCIEADAQYCSAENRISQLKPSPKGLAVIKEDFGLDSENMLMIGDRMEKDGECARLAGIDYMILPRSKSKRRYDF